MFTPFSYKHTALRAVHTAKGGVNIGVVSRPNVNPSYRFDFLPAVDSESLAAVKKAQDI